MIRRLLKGFACIFTGLFIQWLGSLISRCGAQVGVEDSILFDRIPDIYCSVFKFTVIDFGLNQISYALIFIGLLYIVFYGFIREIIEQPLLDIISMIVDREKLARETAGSADISPELHREFAAMHLSAATSNKVNRLPEFLDFFITKCVDPTLQMQAFWKQNLDIKIRLKEHVDPNLAENYYQLLDDTSFELWSCAGGGEYAGPLFSEYRLAPHQLPKFFEAMRFSIEINDLKFTLNPLDEHKIEELVRTGKVSFGNCIYLYEDENLVIDLKKKFPLKQGANLVNISETSLISKSDKFYSFDNTMPCSGIRCTIDLPDDLRVIDYAYSHLVFSNSHINQENDIHRHKFYHEGFLFPGLLFAIFWDKNP